MWVQLAEDVSLGKFEGQASEATLRWTFAGGLAENHPKSGSHAEWVRGGQLPKGSFTE
jgi:hypothetical protein